MSGIYIHIPFCKQACHYCNFHFSTSLKYRKEMVDAIIKEINVQKDYLNGDVIQTIYFGGGTPSLLSQEELNRIFEQIQKYHSIDTNAEITLEANPDDLTLDRLQTLEKSPINRLSIGIQSFSEEDLQFMNRAHNAAEAKQCIDNALMHGFSNLTADLIYGSPTTSDEQWQKNIQTLIDYDIPHISCYCLTVEPNTALDHLVKKGKAKPVDEEQSARQFEMLLSSLQSNGYEHYEISNFAKPGMYAKHNSNYWLGKSYLGIGPSAHSFNGESRQWNVAHNAQYIKGITANQLPFEKEILSPATRYNEYIMTSLRTMWGCDLNKIIELDMQIHFTKISQKFLENGTLIQNGDRFHLTTKGKLLADNIAMELFVESAS